ncbi:MAG: type IV pilus biogenesis/stability protein PilW [Pseudomonadota bacterium]
MKILLPLLMSVLALAGCASTSPVGGSAPGAATNIPGSDNMRARVHTELAAGYYSRAQYGVALDELKKALEAESGYAPAHNILALVRAELREDALAEEAFRRAISLMPQYSEAHNNYGLFLCQRGRAEEAMARFEMALGNPLYATPEKALANAGACSLARNDLAKAEMFYTRAVRHAPGFELAVLGMAEVDYRQGRLLAARAKLQHLGERQELNAQGLWLGARVEHAMGDRAAMASYGAQLRRRFPEAMQTQWLILGQYDQNGGLL